jgi:hypothetical protein
MIHIMWKMLELRVQGRREGLGAQTAQVGVEVLGARRQDDALDAVRVGTHAEGLRRMVPRLVVVAGDVEAAQARRGRISAARCAEDRAVTIGMAGRTTRKDSMVSRPSPAAMTSAARPNRTPNPSRRPIARRGVASGALSEPSPATINDVRRSAVRPTCRPELDQDDPAVPSAWTYVAGLWRQLSHEIREACVHGQPKWPLCKPWHFTSSQT